MCNFLPIFSGRTAGLFVAFFLVVWAAGCGESKTPPEEKTAKRSEKAVAPTEAQDDSSHSPEAAMRQMVGGLREKRPEVIWQAVPPGFQREINALVREFAGKMDPEFWRQSFATWKTLARLLREKKSAILSHPELAELSPESRQRLEENWDGLVDLLTILVHSELAELSNLKTFEMGPFLEKTGGKWLSQLAGLSESLGQNSLSGMFAGLEPKTLSQDANTAQMAWMVPGSSEPASTFSLVKLDGRWVPAGWEAAWRQVRSWRAKLREMPAEAFTRQSREKLETLNRAKQTMQVLLATKSTEDFHKTLTEQLGEPAVVELAVLIRTLSGESPATNLSDTQPPETVPKTYTDAGSVTLLIQGAKGTEDEDRIFADVKAALPGDVDVQFDSTKTGLKVVVGPVGDLEQFRRNITFGTVTKFDADEPTLHIEMNR